MQIYLASPLGFSPENNPYLDKVKQQILSQGHTIFCPWEQTQLSDELQRIPQLDRYQERVGSYKAFAAQIGTINEDGIRESDALLAVLDGAEVDSGTASELGFASALGKVCYGLRTDIRDSGDFAGIPVNLQVLHFIERSGGRLFRKIADIEIFDRLDGE